MANAVKFVPRIKELRVHLCSRSESSKGVRDFMEKCYVGLKKANPKFPILVRECTGIQPKLWARYEFGKEVCHDISNKSADQVMSEITTLNK